MFNKRVAAKSSKDSEYGPKDGAETVSDVYAAAALPTAPPLAAPQASRRIGLCYYFGNRLKALAQPTKLLTLRLSAGGVQVI